MADDNLVYKRVKFACAYEKNWAKFFDYMKWKWLYNDPTPNETLSCLGAEQDCRPNFQLHFKKKTTNVYIKLNKSRSNRSKYNAKIIKFDKNYLLVGINIFDVLLYNCAEYCLEGYSDEDDHDLDDYHNEREKTYVSIGYFDSKYEHRLYDAILLNCKKCNKKTIGVPDFRQNYKYKYRCYACDLMTEKNHKIYRDFVLADDMISDWKDRMNFVEPDEKSNPKLIMEGSTYSRLISLK